jgi:hypothetical protein
MERYFDMKIIFVFLLVQFTSISIFGGLRIDAIIYNESGSTVEILFLNGDLDERISHGKSKRIVYPSSSESLPIKINSRQYMYPSIPPSAEFRKISLFKLTFKLVIGEDKRLYLIPYETPPEEVWDAARKQLQPEGWPIKGTLEDLLSSPPRAWP